MLKQIPSIVVFSSMLVGLFCLNACNKNQPGTVACKNERSDSILKVISPLAQQTVGKEVQITGTCLGEYDLVIRVNGEASTYISFCADDRFTSMVSMNGEDGLKSLEVAQQTKEEGLLFDRLCVTQDTTPPYVKIVGPNAALGPVTGETAVQGICETGLPVRVEGEAILEPMFVSCLQGQFEARTMAIDRTGIAEIRALQTDEAGNTGKDMIRVILEAQSKLGSL